MRRFSDQDTFAGLIAAGSLTRAHVAAAACRLADFHRCAPVVADWGPDRVLAVWRRNVGELGRMDHPATWQLDIAAGFGEAFVEAHAPELRRRALLGLARDGHGDLRCEHVLASPAVRVVDRIEFDPGLRQTRHRLRPGFPRDGSRGEAGSAGRPASSQTPTATPA